MFYAGALVDLLCRCPFIGIPLWGAVGVFTTILLIITAIVDGKIEAEEGEWQFTYASWPAIIVVVLFMLRGCSGCSVFRSEDYSQLIGDVETREWTLDVQPKNQSTFGWFPKI